MQRSSPDSLSASLLPPVLQLVLEWLSRRPELGTDQLETNCFVHFFWLEISTMTFWSSLFAVAVSCAGIVAVTSSWDRWTFPFCSLLDWDCFNAAGRLLRHFAWGEVKHVRSWKANKKYLAFIRTEYFLRQWVCDLPSYGNFYYTADIIVCHYCASSSIIVVMHLLHKIKWILKIQHCLHSKLR